MRGRLLLASIVLMLFGSPGGASFDGETHLSSPSNPEALIQITQAGGENASVQARVQYAPRVVKQLSPLLWFGAFVATFRLLTWTFVTLGVLLVVLGAFLPFPSVDEESGQAGKWSMKLGSLQIDYRGGVRLAVIVAGILLIATTVLSELP